MPGRHLSNQEETLLKFWEKPPNSFPRPMLRSIEITGGEGLRGLDGILVPFSYPITAICGKNGSGKSTLLALAALAHHSTKNWHVHWTNTRYRNAKASENRSYYIFPDFFFYGPNEQIPNGVSITWRYHDSGAETSVKFTKSSNQWGKYARRAEREVDYAPLSRLIPAHELNAIRGAFGKGNPQATHQPFNQEYREYFSYIMGAKYEEAEIQRTERLTFAACQTDVSYSGFNMGGGEHCVAHLLHLLHRLPSGGLLVVEEIETCLHPEAQIRLVDVLTKICIKKKMQIICSTHSEVFLDALPRQGRILLRKQDAEGAVVERPSTRFAIYEMKGEVQPELTVYCEDRSAAVLIEETVPYGDRRRIRIIDVGSDATVIRQGVSHRRGDFEGNCLCVPDGDAAEADITGWIKSEANNNPDITPSIEVLPGDQLPPESWVLSQLTHEDYRNAFAEELGCDLTEADGHIEAMRVDLDHHNIAYTLSKRTGIDREDCLRRIMRSVASVHPGLDQLRDRIADMLG